MLPVKLVILFVIIHTGHVQPLDSLIEFDKATSLKNIPVRKYWEPSLDEVATKTDFSGKRFSRHIGVGGIFGGVGVIGGGDGGFAAPVYASPPLAVVSSVPIITTVPVVTAIPSYPVYGGYGGYDGGYGGGFGGFGAGFGVAKFKVKGFGFGAGFLG